jgi:hypothetical protein
LFVLFPLFVQLKTRMDDILTMCERRKVCLKRLSTKPTRPVLAVHPTTSSTGTASPTVASAPGPFPVSSRAHPPATAAAHQHSGHVNDAAEAVPDADREEPLEVTLVEENGKKEKIRCISVPTLLDSSNELVNDILNQNSEANKRRLDLVRRQRGTIPQLPGPD